MPRRMTAPRQVLKGKTYLVTRRCSERRFFLTPSKKTNQLFRYLVAEGAARFGIQVHAACVLSNHFHMVVTDPDAELPKFAQHVNSLLARALNASHGHWESFWAPSSYSAVVLQTPDDIVDKIAYTLANPVKAALVKEPATWPGVWTAPGRIGGAVRRVLRPKAFFRKTGKMPKVVDLELTVPPGFESAETFRTRLRAVLKVEIDKAQEAVEKAKRSYVGVKGVRKQKPADAPRTREPRGNANPHVAAKDRHERTGALALLVAFRQAYRAALEKYRRKEKPVFPAGTYLMRIAHGVACAPG